MFKHIYSVLVVDDELVERQGLQKLISAMDLPLEVALAPDGEIAWGTICSNSPPDVLITDIQMPFMDGLTLITKVHQRFPQTQIIIYSAYDEFEYARKAISAGVLEYLLKPIDIPSFQTLMASAVRRLDERRKEQAQDELIQNAYRESLRQKQLLNLVDHNQSLEPSPLLWDGPAYMLMLYAPACLIDENISFLEGNTFGKNENTTPFQTDSIILNEQQLLIFIHSFGHNLIDDLVEEYAGNWLSSLEEKTGQTYLILLCRAVNTASDYACAYTRLDEALDHLMLFEKSCVLWADKEPLSQPSFSTACFRLADEVVLALEAKNAQLVREKMTQLNTLIASINPASLHLWKRVYASLFRISGENQYNLDAESLHKVLDTLYSCCSGVELQNAGNLWLECLPDKLEKKDSHERSLVRKVKKIIEDNYHTDISLNDIAMHLERTPNHISSIFRYETGESIMKYLTQYRMNIAEHLLATTNKKVSEIAALVGYASSTYFGQVFRSSHGLSPGAYREKKGL